MHQNVIEVEGLRCTYGDHVAVDGVGLTVAPGELFALLGTNGAGKTTTMETLEGHRRPAAGHVRVLGVDPAGDRGSIRPRVGIMLQESGFAGELTVAETAELWDSLRSRPGDPLCALERLDLAHKADVQVKQLSGGERRRLDLALAISGSPEVLFLDEPTTGLDPQSRRRTWEVVSQMVAQGTAVLLTTHYLEEAEALADRLAILHEGRIAVAGTVAEVVSHVPARITFQLPSPPAESFPDLAGRVLPHRGDGYVIETGNLEDDLEVLLAWRRRHDIHFERLAAHDASLEEVFQEVAR
jgi:ABC-2 type transport system ATP-binding protein